MTICDAAARFNSNVASPIRPVWMNYTGGDTLHSVAVTSAAVYIQGHQRWVSSTGVGCTPGCFSREGIAALAPANGAALTWNPGKDRGVGGKDLLLTSAPAGLWVASDTTQIGNPREAHQDLAFLPSDRARPPGWPSRRRPAYLRRPNSHHRRHRRSEHHRRHLGCRRDRRARWRRRDPRSGGNDTICGGTGKDRIKGGAGNDPDPRRHRQRPPQGAAPGTDLIRGGPGATGSAREPATTPAAAQSTRRAATDSIVGR